MTLSQLLNHAARESNGDLETARTMLRDRNTYEANQALSIIAKRVGMFVRLSGGVKPTLIAISRTGYVRVETPDMSWAQLPSPVKAAA
jgi:hypothetical protein